MVVVIKEKSWLAKVAARKLKASQAAIVIKNTIHLHGASREEFLQSASWIRHEIAHVYQYKRYGSTRFLCLYILESIVAGYYNNRFEREARQSESDAGILHNIAFR